MKIEATDIPDVTETNLDESKVVLADNIIENVYPLFDTIYEGKIQQLADLKKQFVAKKQKVKENKTELEILMSEYKKKQKLSVLLSRVEKLVDSGLTYDASLKHEMVILLKIANKLPQEKIDERLKEIMNLLRKRFSR